MHGLQGAAALIGCVLATSLTPSAPARAGAASRSAAADEVGLVGTWRLVRFEDTGADGKVTRRFGEHPLGYFVYDPTGHLSIQIMRNPPIAPFAAATPSEAELREANRAYLAYFGTYRVDKAKGVLHHVIEGATNPSYVANPDQVRPYRLQGDTLIIEIRDPKAGTYQYRELQRVR